MRGMEGRPFRFINRNLSHLAEPGKCLCRIRACFKIERGAVRRDFGLGQGEVGTRKHPERSMNHLAFRKLSSPPPRPSPSMRIDGEGDKDGRFNRVLNRSEP